MKPIFALLLALVLAMPSLLAQSASLTEPIFATLDAKSANKVVIFGQRFSREEANKFLAESSRRHGSLDPVIIVADPAVPAAKVTDLVEMARTSHHFVYAVLRAHPGADPVLFYTADSTIADYPHFLERLTLPPELSHVLGPDGRPLKTPRETLEELAAAPLPAKKK